MFRTLRRHSILAGLLLLACASELRAASVTVAWDPNPEVGVKYVVYWGTQHAVYTSSASAGSGTSYAVSGLVPGKTYYFAVQAVSADGLASPFSEEVKWTVPASSTVLTATPATLRFAARKDGASGALSFVTGVQAVTISVSGGSTAWTAAASQPWVHVTNASGSGSGQFTVSIVNPGNVIGGSTNLNATVTITPSAPGVSPVTVAVNLLVTQDAYGSAPPFGQIDTPLQGATGLVGSIAVTGWALDDVGVSGVKIYRGCLSFEDPGHCQDVDGHSVVYVGDATFVVGARPDVEAAFPAYPQASRAGWGYLMLTNSLPHVGKGQMFGGQGTFALYAFAVDQEGQRRLLGRSHVDHTPTTLTVVNDSIAVPFGAIDTPFQGQTVSGLLPNFGWVLTPDNDKVAGNGDTYVPTDGSTVRVFIDGAAVGSVAYDQCRGDVGSTVPAGLFCNDDVANIFGNPAPKPAGSTRAGNPTRYRNLDAGRGAIGAYLIDTSALANGIHTISWGVTDSAGRAAGIGSRFFTVLNAAAADKLTYAAPAAGSSADPAREAAPAVRGYAHSLMALAPAAEPVRGRTGMDLDATLEDVPAGDDGVRRVQVGELGRVELELGPVDAGYLVANGTLRDLPVGSRLDAATGTFTWAPGAGYVGKYQLAFVRGSEQLRVDVTVRPVTRAASGQNEIRMWVDGPRNGDQVSGTFSVVGWALDPKAAIGSGIDAVDVWATRRDVVAAQPIYLGPAQLGGWRPDVAGMFGAQFNRAAYGLDVAGLAAGQYDVTVFARSRRTGRWEDARTIALTVK